MGVDARFGAIHGPGLREDVADVAGDGVEADDEVFADLGVALAGREETEDLDLANGEPVRVEAMACRKMAV